MGAGGTSRMVAVEEDIVARSSGARVLRNLIGVVVAVVVVAMLGLLARVVFQFFGALQSGGFHDALMTYTAPVVLPIPVGNPATPYGGVFDLRATLSLLVFLVVEFLLTGLRRRV